MNNGLNANTVPDYKLENPKTCQTFYGSEERTLKLGYVH